MANAITGHILVATETECDALKTQIDEGSSFADLAQQHSQCPSGWADSAKNGFQGRVMHQVLNESRNMPRM